jgi:menaquinone-9 beta-reductase
MSQGVDVLVVGARCAGAPLALMLARAGKRVVAIDADDMPSDQPMSTHFIGPYGMMVLTELGIADKVRALAPPITKFKNGLDDVVAELTFTPGIEGSCPRRTDLDAMLVDEARKAGAEVRLRTKLVDVIREGDRIVGGVVEHDGKREELRCDVLVGADGRSSKVASLVGAKEYRDYDMPRCAHWAYWRRPSWYSDDPRYRGAAAIIHEGDDYWVIFPTNTDQILVGFVIAKEKEPEYTGRVRERYLERVRSFHFTRPICEGEPISKVISFVKGRFFFREAAGKGWALVGDAGLFKDYAPGLGISDALRDARSLSAAIVEGTDEALVKYWRERDVASLELFEFARDMGSPGYNNTLNKKVFKKLRDNPKLHDRIRGVHERRTSPFAAFSLGQILRWTAGELARGRFGVVKPFLAAGKNGQEVAKELERWKALAKDARDAAAKAKAAKASVTADAG